MKNKKKLYFLPVLLCAFLLFPCFSINTHAESKPSRVANLKCGVTTQNSINLSWNKLPGSSGYQVYRSDAIDGTYQKIMDINPKTNAFCNLHLKSGTEYYYKVRAIIKGNYGDFPEALSAHTKSAKKSANTRMRINLRKHAGTNHPVLVTLNTRTKVSIICTAKDKTGVSWSKVTCKINGKSYTGYIRSDLLTKPVVTPKNKTGIVMAGVLNVRSAASTSGRIIGKLYRGQKVTILPNNTNPNQNLWYYVSYKQNGRTIKGYVSSRYIKL